MRIYLPDKLKYTKTHEWVKVKGDMATIGISQYLIKKLGPLVYLDLPQLDDELLAGVTLGEVESTKGIADLKCPLEGTIVKINKRLFEDLDTLINDPYVAGWLVKLRITNAEHSSAMMTADEYKKYIGSLSSGKK